MKRRMEQLLNGRFEYEVPKLTLSDTQINLTTNEGENVRGELYVAAEDNRRIKGMTMSSNRRVLLAKEKFSGTTVCIPYGLDVKGLSAGETVDAVITINSNLGEYQVPVHAEITDDGIQTSRGAVDNLEAFIKLAESDYREAFRLYTSESFLKVLQGEDPGYESLYRGMSRNPVTYQHMEEFLIAMGEEALAEQIKKCFETDTPMPSALHDAAMLLYRQYLVVGGMPECVLQFAQTKDYILVRHTQDTILASYLNDMSKYNHINEIKKTRLVYDNITVQLSKKNTRFQYKLVKKGGRSSEFENAIEWLCLSGIVSQVYKVEQIKKPLENYRDIDAFKVYVSDLGLLCAKKDLAANDVLYMVDELNDFKGGMAENYVHVQLSINGYRTYYWESERGAEIDFIIQRGGHLIPIEVKSANNTKAKSLAVYMNTYKPAYAIKLSAKNFSFENGKKTVPLYAAFCI